VNIDQKNCRVKGPNYILGLGRKYEQSKEEQMIMNDSDSGFNEQDTNEKSVRGGITPQIQQVQLKYVF